MAALGLFMVLPNLPGLEQSRAVGEASMTANIPYLPALGLQDPQEYRRRNLPLFEASQYANALHLPSSTSVLAVPMIETLPAWHTHYHIVDVWDNAHLVCRDEKQRDAPCYSTTGEALVQVLDQGGIGLLAIRHNDQWVTQTGAFRLEDPMLREHFRLRGYGGGVFFYQRDHQAPLPGQTYVQADLLHRLALGVGTVPALPARESNRIWSVRGHRDDIRLSLDLNSDKVAPASWTITPGPRAQLSFSLARFEWTGWAGGDLVILVNKQVVATETVRDGDLMENWQPVEVDLSPWSGRTITLAMELRAKKPGTTVEVSVADPVVYATEAGDPQLTREPERLFDEATRAQPVVVKFSPATIRAGESYTLSIPQSAGNWAGQWVDLLVACGNHDPLEVPRFRLLDQQGQARVTVDREFQPCQVQVRGVRRSGETRWRVATGSIVVAAPAKADRAR
jgi:hypothetical protein